LNYRDFVSDFDFRNLVCWGRQLRAAHPAQQKFWLQAKDVVGFLFGLKTKNSIDTGVKSCPDAHGWKTKVLKFCSSLSSFLSLTCHNLIQRPLSFLFYAMSS
jgi:hypothetical protein